MSRLDDALRVRGRILSSLSGRWKYERTNIGPMLRASAGPFSFLHRTPLQHETLKNMRLANLAVGLVHEMPLDYGLDAWLSYNKVLNIEWDHSGAFRMTSFRQCGSWEPDLLRSLHECRSDIPADEGHHPLVQINAEFGQSALVQVLH